MTGTRYDNAHAAEADISCVGLRFTTFVQGRPAARPSCTTLRGWGAFGITIRDFMLPNSRLVASDETEMLYQWQEKMGRACQGLRRGYLEYESEHGSSAKGDNGFVA